MLRYSEVFALVLAVALVVWLDAPQLLAPVAVAVVILGSIDRRRRGIWPWLARKR